MLSKTTCRRTTRTNITIKCGVSQFAMLLWGSRLHGFVSHRFFARIFCTDFLHGFFARIFCTDFLRGFFARIYLHRFFARPDFFAQISARIACKNCLYRCCTDFCTDFFGVSQNTCWEAPKFHGENPPKNSPCFGGLLGRGSGGRRVR